MDALSPYFYFLYDQPGILILASLISLGYVLRFVVEGFPNRYTGWTVTLVSFYATLLLRPESWQTKLAIAFIYSALNALLYEQVIKVVKNWITNKIPSQGETNGESK